MPPTMKPQADAPIVERGLTGHVKFYDEKKGWGIIICSDRRELYVHHTGLATKAFGPLQDNWVVTFDVANGARGLKCVNVEKA